LAVLTIAIWSNEPLQGEFKNKMKKLAKLVRPLLTENIKTIKTTNMKPGY
jgi:hypothetical protein